MIVNLFFYSSVVMKNTKHTARNTNCFQPRANDPLAFRVFGGVAQVLSCWSLFISSLTELLILVSATSCCNSEARANREPPNQVLLSNIGYIILCLEYMR